MSCYYLILFWLSSVMLPYFGSEALMAQNAPPYMHYRFTDFKPGTVVLKDGTVSKMHLNYHLITEEIILDLGHTKLPYREIASVSQVRLDSIILVPYENGFLELLEEGAVSLLLRRRQIVKQVGQDTGYGTTSQTSTSITPGGLHQTEFIYDNNLPDDYDTRDEMQFYLRWKDKFMLVQNLKKAGQLIPELEEDLNDLVKSNKLKSDRQDDLLKWVRYCNRKLQ